MVGMTLVSCLGRWDELGSAETSNAAGGLRVGRGCGHRWLHRGLEAANPGKNRSCALTEMQVECTRSCPELAPEVLALAALGGLWAGQGLSGARRALVARSGQDAQQRPLQSSGRGFGGAELPEGW